MMEQKKQLEESETRKHPRKHQVQKCAVSLLSSSSIFLLFYLPISLLLFVSYSPACHFGGCGQAVCLITNGDTKNAQSAHRAPQYQKWRRLQINSTYLYSPGNTHTLTDCEFFSLETISQLQCKKKIFFFSFL